MEVLEVRGQEDGSNDDSEKGISDQRASLETIKHIGFPTKDRNPALNCRVLFIIQPTMSIKLRGEKKRIKGQRL